MAGIELALLNRSEDAREDGMRLGPGLRAVATTDLARDHGWSKRLLGAPVGGVDRLGVEEKRKHGREFDREVRREPACDVCGAGSIDQGVELILEMPARDGDAVRGQAPLLIAVADGQRVLQDALHAWRELAFPMITDQEATPAQQVRQTRLVDRVIEPSIGRPAVAHEDAREVGAEQGRRLCKSTPRLNRIDGRVGCCGRPQPLQLGVDFPPGLVGRDDGAAADLFAQRVVGRFRPVRRSADRVDESARRDGQPKALAKQCGDLPERQPELFVQHHREGHGGGPELRGGGADGIRRLQRMASLDAPATVAAVTDGDLERAYDRPDLREVFLILGRVPGRRHTTTAIGAPKREWRRMAFVDVGRDRSAGLLTIRGAGLAARPVWPTTWCAPRERGRLSMQRSPRIVQLVFESADLLSQALPFLTMAVSLAFQVPSQALVFALLPFQFGDQLLARGRAPARLHALVMP